ncbi:hypothetical protein D3C76_1047750 [compost metagenome]
MCSTYSIDTHLLKQEELSAQSDFVNGSAQATQVMMLADSVNFDVAAVQVESLLTVQFEGTEAEGMDLLVDHLILDQKLGPQQVEIRIVDIP